MSELEPEMFDEDKGPDDEHSFGGIWTRIKLEALVKFLYAQQSQGAVSDVRALSVQPAGGKDVPAGRLKGTFTIDYAYRREPAAPENKPEPAAPAPAETEQP